MTQGMVRRGLVLMLATLVLAVAACDDAVVASAGEPFSGTVVDADGAPSTGRLLVVTDAVVATRLTDEGWPADPEERATFGPVDVLFPTPDGQVVGQIPREGFVCAVDDEVIARPGIWFPVTSCAPVSAPDVGARLVVVADRVRVEPGPGSEPAPGLSGTWSRSLGYLEEGQEADVVVEPGGHVVAFAAADSQPVLAHLGIGAWPTGFDDVAGPVAGGRLLEVGRLGRADGHGRWTLPDVAGEYLVCPASRATMLGTAPDDHLWLGVCERVVAPRDGLHAHTAEGGLRLDVDE
jgi:hypothetical protein